MERAFEWAEELPEDRGRGVAKDNVGTASEHRGHEAAVEAQASVAYGVDALVDSVELSSSDAVSNRASAQPSAYELPPRRHPMLPRGDFRYLHIGCVAFLTHVGT